MPLTKETFTRLIALQERDGALDKLQADLDRIPAEIARLREGLEQEKSRLAQAKDKALTLEKRKKEKELELAQKEESAKKHSLELNQVKSNDAFKALQKEIDLAKAQGGEIETEILVIMDEIDACRKDEKAAAAELSSVEKKVGAEVSVLEGKLAEEKAKYDAAKAARDEAAAPVPADVLKVYTHVRSRGKLDAIVPIEGDSCSACHVTQPQGVIVEAAKAKSLVTCESCQRILYRPESLAAKA